MQQLSARSRFAALATAASVALLTGLSVASPAYAANVATYGELATEFGGSGTATLTADISSPSSELVLADGATMVLDLGAFDLAVHNIVIGAGSTLTITGTTGVLTADASDINPGDGYAAARAGIHVPTTGTLIISGGVINATGGGLSASGIGGQGHGSLSGTGSIMISGGTVTASGSSGGAGIGTNSVVLAGEGTVAISGGTVTATGNGGGAGIGGAWAGHTTSITISGGTITAISGDGGAGIGGGDRGGGGGTISITGGVISASTSGSGAAIGTGVFFGFGDGSATIDISGASVTATASGNGAAIGSGEGNTAVNTTITSGTVVATNTGLGAAIGGGASSASGVIVIDGGTITATSDGGAGIGGGFLAAAGSITINGGTLSITGDGGGAAIGGGFLGSASTIAINGGTVTAVSETLAPVIGSGVAGGNGGTITFGSLAIVSVSTDQASVLVGGTNGSANITLDGTLTILEGTLTAPTSGGGLTIGTTGRLRGPGGLAGASPIINNGSITGSVNVTATDVQVNNFLVTFTADPSVGYAGEDIRVYATSFNNAELALPDPAPAGYDTSWYTAASGGTLFTTASAIASDITLFPLFTVTLLPATGVDALPVLSIGAVITLLGLALLLRRRLAPLVRSLEQGVNR